jgi:hypothetical protein
MIMDEAGEAIIGNITLFQGTIKETIGDDRKVVEECATEEERVKALKEWFGVEFTEEERNGLPADLRLD